MTVEEKIGQLFVVPVCPERGAAHMDEVKELVLKRHIGGIICMGGWASDQIAFLEELQSLVTLPLMTFQDAEWGVGMRLKDVPPLPKNLTLGAVEDLSLLKAYGRELARQCRLVGIWADFAPVVDVNSNPNNPVIHRRSLGEDPFEVARKALAIMEGMREGGVISCVKHFPGHGDTTADSHFSLPKIEKEYEEFLATELIPFRVMIEEGVDLVMVGHLEFPFLCSEPASLSYAISTQLLRDELGFKGVVVTDALNMGALTHLYTLEEIFLGAFFAGSDLLLTSSVRPEVLSYLITRAIPQAIDLMWMKCQRGEITEEMLDQKLERIQRLREKEMPPLPFERMGLKRDLFRSALTSVGVRLPRIPTGERVVLVSKDPDPQFERALRRFARVDTCHIEALDQVADYPYLILSLRKGDVPIKIPDQAIVTIFDTPYCLYDVRHDVPILVGYEEAYEAKEAAADALFGQLTPRGKLPIQLSRRKKGDTI